MDGMISAARQLWEDAQNDEDLRAWWRRVDVFVQKVKFILSCTLTLVTDCDPSIEPIGARIHSRADVRQPSETVARRIASIL
jgi:hypothetical protein